MGEAPGACKYCHSSVGEEYLVNQCGDYFCNDDCTIGMTGGSSARLVQIMISMSVPLRAGNYRM